mgnify:CR=1
MFIFFFAIAAQLLLYPKLIEASDTVIKKTKKTPKNALKLSQRKKISFFEISKREREREIDMSKSKRSHPSR